MKIVVGHDGSASSSAAVRWAANEASRCGAPLRIVECVSIPAPAASAAGWIATDALPVLRDLSEQRLGELGDSIAAAYPHLEIITEVCLAPAASALCEDLEPDDLVVVGASRRHGAAAFWLGNTPRRLTRISPCPVVVVPQSISDPPLRVVVGVGETPDSETALRWAAGEATRHGVSLHLIHAWIDPFMPDNLSSIQATEVARIEARCELDRALSVAREVAGPDVTGELIEGQPSEALQSALNDGDLLVLAGHGRNALAAAVIGSVVNDVLDHVSVPVAVIRADDALGHDQVGTRP